MFIIDRAKITAILFLKRNKYIQYGYCSLVTPLLLLLLFLSPFSIRNQLELEWEKQLCATYHLYGLRFMSITKISRPTYLWVYFLCGNQKITKIKKIVFLSKCFHSKIYLESLILNCMCLCIFQRFIIFVLLAIFI